MLTRVAFSNGDSHAGRVLAVVILVIWIGSAFCTDWNQLGDSNRIACDRIPKMSGPGWIGFPAGDKKTDMFIQHNTSFQLRCDGTVALGSNAAVSEECLWTIDPRDRQRWSYHQFQPNHTGTPHCSLTFSSFSQDDAGLFICRPDQPAKQFFFRTELAVSPNFDQEAPTVSVVANDNGTVWTLACPAKSTPAPCFRWYYKEKELKTNESDIHGCNVTGSVLTCETDRFSTLQPFTCTASNSISVLSYQFPNISLTNVVKNAMTSGSLESGETDTTDDSSALPKDTPSLCNCSCDNQTSIESPSDTTTHNFTNIIVDATRVPAPTDGGSTEPHKKHESELHQQTTLNIERLASNVRQLVTRSKEEPVVQSVVERALAVASRPFSDLISVGVAFIVVFNIF